MVGQLKKTNVILTVVSGGQGQKKTPHKNSHDELTDRLNDMLTDRLTYRLTK